MSFVRQYQGMGESLVYRTSSGTCVGAALVAFNVLVMPAVARGQEQGMPTVTVEAKKEAVSKKLDKTVYDVSNAPRALNGTAQDVLQSTPAVTVSAGGEISVQGNKQVTVLVDGKPTAMMSGEDRPVALQTMSGADIASIEVITNPSAAQNANGGAILNIVLKRNRTPGSHAQIRSAFSDRGLWNTGASADLTDGPMSLHGNLGYRHDGTLKFRQSLVDWINPLSARSGQTLQTSEVFVFRNVQTLGFGVDYALTDAERISLSAGYNRRRSRPVFDVLNASRTDGEESAFHRISDGPNQQADSNVSLSYSRNGAGTALKAAVQSSDMSGLIDKSYRDVFLTPQRPPDFSRGTTKSGRRLNQATLDYTRMLEYGQWGSGFDAQNKTDVAYNYQALVDPSNGAETPELSTTNSYSVRTTVTAVYLTNKIARNNWEVLLGGRGERMAVQVSAPGSSTRTEHWTAVNPSMHAQYDVSDRVALTLSYRRSLQMPDPRDLNPFTTYVDAQNLSRGNPGLKPQALDAWETGLDLSDGRVSGGIKAFYRTSRDTVTDSRSFEKNVLITSKQNGGRARSAGLTGTIEWKPNERLSFGLDGGAYSVVLESFDSDELVRQRAVSGYANARAGYRVGSDDVALDVHWQSAGIAPLGEYGATSSVNLSWKHQVSKTLSFTVNANDIFDGSLRTYRTDTRTFRQSGFDHFVAKRIYVGFVGKLK